MSSSAMYVCASVRIKERNCPYWSDPQPLKAGLRQTTSVSFALCHLRRRHLQGWICW